MDTQHFAQGRQDGQTVEQGTSKHIKGATIMATTSSRLARGKAVTGRAGKHGRSLRVGLALLGALALSGFQMATTSGTPALAVREQAAATNNGGDASARVTNGLNLQNGLNLSNGLHLSNGLYLANGIQLPAGTSLGGE